MNSVLFHLNSLTPAEMETWIAEALAGRIDLPRLAPDEPSSVSLARVAQGTSGTLTKKFEQASIRLAAGFAARPRWSATGYESELLSLVADLRLYSVSRRFEKLAREFPTTLPIEARQQVLHAIHDIGRADARFWKQIGSLRPRDFGCIAFSALLRSREWDSALQLLPKLPDDSELAGTAAVHLQLAWRQIDFTGQLSFLRRVAGFLPQCKTLVQSTLQLWLNSRGLSPNAIATTASPRLETMLRQRNQPVGYSQTRLTEYDPKLELAFA